MSNILKCIIKW